MKAKTNYLKRAMSYLLIVLIIVSSLPLSVADDGQGASIFTKNLALEAVNYQVGDVASPLSVNAGDGATYQWYAYKPGVTSGAGVVVSNQAQYTPSTDVAGTTYYRVRATKGDTSEYSYIAKVTVSFADQLANGIASFALGTAPAGATLTTSGAIVTSAGAITIEKHPNYGDFNKAYVAYIDETVDTVYLYYPSAIDGLITVQDALFGQMAYYRDPLFKRGQPGFFENYCPANEFVTATHDNYQNGWYTCELSKFSNLGWDTSAVNALSDDYNYYLISPTLEVLSLGGGQVNMFGDFSSPKLYVGIKKVVEADKTALQAIIDDLADDFDDDVSNDNYYHQHDRWNGKTYIDNQETGFFELFTNSEYQDSLTLLNQANAKQIDIDNQVIALNQAIAELIKKEQLNTTALYERLLYLDAHPLKFRDSYTDTSLAVYDGAVQDGRDYLASLFDEAGNATAANSADNQAQYDAVVASLDYFALADLLDAKITQSSNNALPEYSFSYDAARYFVNQRFSLDAVDAGDYNAASYAAFTAQHQQASQFLADHVKPTGEMGRKASFDYLTNYSELWQACYGLAAERPVEVKLTVVDRYMHHVGAALQDYPPTAAVGQYTVELDVGNASLADLLADKAVFDIAGRQASYSSVTNDSKILVYINGEYVNQPYDEMETHQGKEDRRIRLYGTQYPTSNSADYARDVQLKDGDEVLVVITKEPFHKPYITYMELNLDEVADDIKYQTIRQDGVALEELSVVAGQAVTLTATAHTAMFDKAAGAEQPLVGGRVTISEMQNSKAAAMASAPLSYTGQTTDDNGQFTLQYYTPGWYAVNIYDVDSANLRGGLSNGKPLYLEVTAPTDEMALIAELRAKLDNCYQKYPVDFYDAAHKEALDSAYQTAVAAFATPTLVACDAATQTGLAAMQATQQEMQGINNGAYRDIQWRLAEMPDDVTKLAKGRQADVDALIACYNGLSSYQQGMLSAAEQTKYQAIVAANAAGLPELAPFKLTVEVISAEDDPVVVAAVNDLVATIKGFNSSSRQPLHGFYGQKYPDDGLIPSELSNYGAVWATVGLDPLALVYPRVYGPDDQQNTVEWSKQEIDGVEVRSWHPVGKNWTVSDEAFEFEFIDDPTSQLVTTPLIKHGFTLNIEGVAYELKEIVYEGIKESEMSLVNTEHRDNDSTYKGKKLYHGINFEDYGRRFLTPYNDVTIKLIYGKVDGDDLAGKKETARRELSNNFNEYDKIDYSATNWLALVRAYQDGMRAIVAAKDDAAVGAALQDAKDAMLAVQKRPAYGDEEIISGEFNAGKQVGEVTVIVENKTFSAGAFTGEFIREEGFAIGENDTMMTTILRALAKNGYSWNGTGSSSYEIAYLGGISKDGASLSEFDGGGGSGWMGTLNDFFTNEGFQQFSVANGKFGDGDVIRVQYTCQLGVDIGGDWNDANTKLASLTVDGGQLLPEFEATTTEYTVLIDGPTADVTPHYQAANRNYLAKTFLNKIVRSNEEDNFYFGIDQTIPVNSGDVIYIGIGEKAWPSMNKQGGSSLYYTPTWYSLTVVDKHDGAQLVIDMIERLPKPSALTLQNVHIKKPAIMAVRLAYDGLTASEQAKVSNVAALQALEAKLADLEAAKTTIALFAKIPRAELINDGNKEAVKADLITAYQYYKALSTGAKQYVPLVDIQRYNQAIDKLKALGVAITDEDVTVIDEAKAALAELVGLAEAKQATDYTVDSFNALQATLVTARAVLADDYATTEAIESAQGALQAALDQLVDRLYIDTLPTVPVVEVNYNTAQSEAVAKLPATVTLTDNKGNNYEVAVNWQISGYQATQAGRYPALGMLNLTGVPQLAEGTANQLTSEVVVLAKSQNYQVALQTSLQKIAAETTNPTTATLGGDWSMLALGRGNYEIPKSLIEKYKANVLTVVKEKMATSDDRLHPVKSTEHARAILGLTSVGIDPRDLDGIDITKAFSSLDYIEGQGLNGPVFALIALDTHDYQLATAAAGERQATRDNIIDAILAKEIAGGGFAFFGDTPDPDMTAMTLQALAPYRTSRSDVKAAIERGLKVLSEIQTGNGGYSAWGSSSSESIAQVIVALTALDIDPARDPAFVKDGNSLVDALLRFYVEGGGFKHVMDGAVNDMATDQGTYALVAYDRFVNGKTTLYDMRDVSFNDVIIKQPSIRIEGAKEGQAYNKAVAVTITARDYQGAKLTPMVYLNGGLLQAKDDIYQLNFVQEQNVLKVVATDSAGNIAEKQLTLYYFAKDDSDEDEDGPSVTLSVDKLTIDKGYVLEPTKVELRAGDTVWDVFRRELTRRDIAFEYSFYDKYNSVYIESIDGDGEFDHGSGSGWMYSVNDVYPQVGASLTALQDGDVVKWRYTTNLGYDIGGGPAVGDDAGLRNTLNEYLISAKAYSASDYTQSSYAALQKAIAAGEALLADTSASLTQLLEATQAIKRAIDAMQRLSADERAVAAKEAAQDGALPETVEAAQMALTELFKDALKISDWAAESIRKAVQYKLVQGDDKGYFNPQQAVTRAEIVTMLINMIGEVSVPDNAAVFSDVKQTDWFYQAVRKASALGLISGMGDGRFMPAGDLTREQFAVIVMNYLNEDVAVDKLPQDAAAVSAWAKDSVFAVFNLGLIQGDGVNFDPQDKVTREMAATIMVRVKEYVDARAKQTE